MSSTVRDVAQALGVSPATISTAWGELHRFKVVAGRRRNGVWVCGNQATPRPVRFERIGNFSDHVLDLTLSAPDPALLPPLDDALRHGAAAEKLHSYQRVPILPSLQQAIETRWPYPAEAFVATNGGYEAVHVAVQALMMPGSVIAIEDPTAMRLLDILAEQFALVTLAARGIVVLPGQMCTTSGWQHIRVSTSLLNAGVDVVADAIALSEC